MANFDISKYVPVSERIAQFYQRFPKGRILTTMLSHDSESGMVIFRAEAYRQPDDAEPSSVGHAFEVRAIGHVNKTSFVENCETSAVGRALAMLGLEVARGVASREEMQKVERLEQESETLEVIREEGQYRVGKYTVTKPNGKVICSCKKAGCTHIESVRKFARKEAGLVTGAAHFQAYPDEPPF